MNLLLSSFLADQNWRKIGFLLFLFAILPLKPLLSNAQPFCITRGAVAVDGTSLQPGSSVNAWGEFVALTGFQYRFWATNALITNSIYNNGSGLVTNTPAPTLWYFPSVYQVFDGVVSYTADSIWTAPATPNSTGFFSIQPAYTLDGSNPCGIMPEFFWPHVNYRTYKVAIDALGFTGDHALHKWPPISGGASTPIDSPDGTAYTWTASGTINNAAAYTKNALPTVFGRFKISPTLAGVSLALKFRLKKGGIVISSTNSLTISGEYGNFSGLVINNTRSTLGASSGAWAWEISYDSITWHSAGSSGPQLYFIHNSPVSPPFHGPFSGDHYHLYDAAIVKAIYYAAGESTETNILSKISAGTSLDTIYNPERGIGLSTHPLFVYNEPLGVQCIDHAVLTQGLAQSVGVPTAAVFLWGGTNATSVSIYSGNNGTGYYSAQYSRFANGAVPANPHFYFHAVVLTTAGPLYDPSYGDSYQVWNPLELAPGASARLNGNFPANTHETFWNCSH